MKFTRVAGPVGAPTIYLIPGGPGLSSNTLRSLDLLCRSFSLAYIDYQGTNGARLDASRDVYEIADEIAKVISADGNDAIVLGHSFGGLLAGLVAIRHRSLRGVIFVSTPFSERAFEEVRHHYILSEVSGSKAETDWSNRPSLGTFKAWVADYGSLYFRSANAERGRSMILDDPASSELFQLYGGVTKTLGKELLKLLPKVTFKKFFIGDRWGLLPGPHQEADAKRIGADFYLVEDASHFVMFDQPESVAQLIEAKFATQKKNEGV
jgi:pimeloyl-ACP methyl ester carboxylesterase